MGIYLNKNFRVWIFCNMYKKSNSSLSDIARQFDYRGNGKNGKIRDMWLGIIGIPEKKMDIISQITKILKKEILSNQIKKEESEIVSDWMNFVLIFEKIKNPNYKIFKKILEK